MLDAGLVDGSCQRRVAVRLLPSVCQEVPDAGTREIARAPERLGAAERPRADP
jgi:hypothetical protein